MEEPEEELPDCWLIGVINLIVGSGVMERS